MMMIFISAGVVSDRCTYPENIKDENNKKNHSQIKHGQVKVTHIFANYQNCCLKKINLQKNKGKTNRYYFTALGKHMFALIVPSLLEATVHVSHGDISQRKI